MRPTCYTAKQSHIRSLVTPRECSLIYTTPYASAHRSSNGLPPSSSPYYRLVVADIDGTLLDSTSNLRPRVIEAIDRARAAGIIFTLATGRRYLTTLPILRSLGLQEDTQLPQASHAPRFLNAGAFPPLVLITGAVVTSVDGKEVLFRHPVPRDDAQHAVDAIVRLGLQPIIYEDRVVDQLLLTGPADYDSPGARSYLEHNPHLVQRRSYDRLVVDADPLEIAVIGDRPVLEAAIPYLTLANCRTIISYSGNLDSYFMEVFHRHCSKGRAVQDLAGYLDVAMEQVVCIGDNWNDVEMLAMAGCGLAVANAAPGVPAYARRLAPSNDEDAVAATLEQILAGQEPGEPNPEYDPRLRA